MRLPHRDGRILWGRSRQTYFQIAPPKKNLHKSLSTNARSYYRIQSSMITKITSTLQDRICRVKKDKNQPKKIRNPRLISRAWMTQSKMAAVHAPSARCTQNWTRSTRPKPPLDLHTVSSAVSSHDHDIQDVKTGLHIMMGDRVQSLTPMIKPPLTIQAHLQAGTTSWRPPKQKQTSGVPVTRVPFFGGY